MSNNIILNFEDEQITVYEDKRAVLKTKEKEIVGEFVGYVYGYPTKVLFMFDKEPKWVYLK